MPGETFTGSATPELRRVLTASRNGLLDWHDAFTTHYGLTPGILSEPNPGFEYTPPDSNQTRYRLARIKPSDRQLTILGRPVDQVLIEAQDYRGSRTPSQMFLYYKQGEIFQTEALRAVWTHGFMGFGKFYADEGIFLAAPGQQISHYLTREEPEDTTYHPPLLYLPNFNGYLEPFTDDQYFQFGYDKLGQLENWTCAIGERRKMSFNREYLKGPPERLATFPRSYDILRDGILPFLTKASSPLHMVSQYPIEIDGVLADTPTNRVLAPFYRRAGLNPWAGISPRDLLSAQTVIKIPGFLGGLLENPLMWDHYRFYGEALHLLQTRVSDEKLLGDTAGALALLETYGILKELFALRDQHPTELPPAVFIRALATVLTIQADKIEEITGDPNLAYEKPKQPTNNLPKPAEVKGDTAPKTVKPAPVEKEVLPKRSTWLARLTGH